MSNRDSMPEDSILRRHYETHLKMMEQSKNKPSPGSAPGGSQPASASDSTSLSGGFLGWLKKVFLGKP
jgi:hypothetical protein